MWLAWLMIGLSFMAILIGPIIWLKDKISDLIENGKSKKDFNDNRECRSNSTINREHNITKSKHVEIGKEEPHETCVINGHVVRFYDKNHRYTVDGVECISVSSIVKVASKYNSWDDYSNVSKSTLDHAAQKGTAMHKVIENYEKYGEVPQRLYVDEFNGYMYLKEKYKFKCLDNERIVLFCDDNDKAVFCGRLDMIIRMDDKVGICDLKRTYKLYPKKVAFQLNLYRLAYMQSYHTSIDFISCIRLRDYSVRQFVTFDIDDDETIRYINKYAR